MDTVISSALEEICSQGQTGLCLSSLFPKLQPLLSSLNLPLSPGVKTAVWQNLLTIPMLQFLTKDGAVSPAEPSIQAVEDAEKVGLKMVAKEQLADNFIGLYDVRSATANISSIQLRVLQRLAMARTNGLTQSELCKEFGMEGRNFFYVVKNLESRGLIVRQSALVKTIESGNEGELRKNVITNVMYLYRYAKPLGSQQRVEIIKEERSLEDMDESLIHGDDSTADHFKEDVSVKDFLPAMKAVCDKLEEAKGKVLLVSDIKKDLGYNLRSGHRAWRSVCGRLKDAHYVEEFDAKVNGKVVNCLRLLKSFSTNKPKAETLACGDNDGEKEPIVRFGRQCPITHQLVELPIEHQVFDIVDAEGSKGVPVKEVCKRLGIKNKKNYTRFSHMFPRFGMHMQAETDKKAMAYRIWTPGNYNAGRESAFSSKPTKVNGENTPSSSVCNVDVPKSDQHSDCDPSIRGGDQTSPDMNNNETNKELDCASPGDDMANHALACPEKHKKSPLDKKDTASGSELQIVSVMTETSLVPLESAPSPFRKQLKSRSNQEYPYAPLTADFQRREQRIMERLQDERFLLRAELYRWLVGLEKDKRTIVDRKTIDRILNKLQEQGHCKCIHIRVPVITNCGRSRTTQVILHPSEQSLTSELVGEIHDRLRIFEMQTRSQPASKCKNSESIPELNNVERTPSQLCSDAVAMKSEVMRSNGFVLAKMVRTKLLHGFLWQYVSCLPGWDVLSSGKQAHDLNNPHSTCCLFSLDAVIKAMPLELFLQVVGSTQKFDDMIDKCKSGLCLSDLPLEEYKCLMDTLATGRLSLIIDILRRLKLIRLVTEGQWEDVDRVPLATFTHALELKPYIEEPLSLAATSSNFRPADLRPRIRHDFILSTKEAVDVYWQTLEYCYATANPTSALHSFPGSAVHEVFLHRSWTSTRVMTADQRAELLKRVLKDDPNKKLAFRDCEKIAKDLNLTLQQVLRVYYSKRRRRLKCQDNKDEYQPLNVENASASRKRKRSSRRHRSRGHQEEQNHDADAVNQYTEEQSVDLPLPEEHGINLHEFQEDNQLIDVVDPRPNEEDEGCHSAINQHVFSKMRPTRQRRFSWTEEADRNLVIVYARYRAVLGAKFHRVDWGSLSDLPAPPAACSKRIASLNRYRKFREALMKLCNILGKRYANYLRETQSLPVESDDGTPNVGSSMGESLMRNMTDFVKQTQETCLKKEPWDNFNEDNVKSALEEVIHYRRMVKLEASKRVAPIPEEWPDLYLNSDEYDPELVPTATTGEHNENHGARDRDFARRSRCHRLQQKFIKLLNGGSHVRRQIYESLAVSNAVELLKLVFLSKSTASQVADLLAETLRRYSEHDLFAAFSYLREKKIMVGGDTGEPFVLSQQFLHNISRSPFPAYTGKRASEFSNWLHEEEKDLMQGEINLNPDLQCGDIFHLFALVSASELSISPCVPDDGVGEAEDMRISKRKIDYNEICDGGKAKKYKYLTESELASRREKGFPGIRVSMCQSTISTANVVETFKDEERFNDVRLGESTELNADMDHKFGSSSSFDHMEEISNLGSSAPMGGNSSELTWEAMTSYAMRLLSINPGQEQTSSFHPELFKMVYGAILKAGDQGMSMEEISQALDIPGENILEVAIDVLQTFGRAFKVNAYESVRVIDALYRSKYFLTIKDLTCQDSRLSSSTECLGKSNDDHLTVNPESHVIDGDISQRKVVTHDSDVHKVTILNLPEPEGLATSQHKDESSNMHEDFGQDKVVFPRGSPTEHNFSSNERYMPILPWINGDGTVNKIVYKGLVRRVLGIVMQNPGIVEDDIIFRMDTLNPQSCRKLLELMILDKHLLVRKMHQTISIGPPAILSTLVRKSLTKPKITSREHFFANPKSTSLL